jgi:nitrogenase molybdenum-iron protein NifN
MQAKPLHVNPLKLSQPMGATLAFLGVDNCMPLMHGAQGCASFTKVFFTRHYQDPIAIQTTAVTDITAVLDGGGKNIAEAVENITKKVKPALIGLFSTGLTETKGDDIKGAASVLCLPVVSVNTPDFEGGLESGWALSASAMIVQLTRTCETVKHGKIALLPHVGMCALELERLKECIASFGLHVTALPDISLSLDGHLGEKQTALSSGGVSVEEIAALGECEAVITVGASMVSCAQTLQRKNPLMRHIQLLHVNGLEATDTLVSHLMALSHKSPSAALKRWRARAQDALLDTHEILGGIKVALIGEPDEIVGYGAVLQEAGASLACVIGATPSASLEGLGGRVGDFEDLEAQMEGVDVVIGNVHAKAIAARFGVPHVERGFPSWSKVGSALDNSVLYEGGAQTLFMIANLCEIHHEEKR